MIKFLSILKHGRFYFWNASVSRDLDYKYCKSVYSRFSEIDFFIRWDIYYFQLAKGQINLLTAKFLFFREYVRIILNFLSFRLREIEIIGLNDSCQSYLLLPIDRKDILESFKLVHPDIHVAFYRIKIRYLHIDFIRFNLLKFCGKLHIKQLYEYEMGLYKLNLPIQGYQFQIYEMRSQSDRAIGKLLSEKNQISVVWLKSNNYLYSYTKLKKNDNLDYRFPLIKPSINRLTECEIIPMNEINGKKVHVVIPTFLDYDKSLIWMECLYKYLKNCSVTTSLHPTHRNWKLLDRFGSTIVDFDYIKTYCDVIIGYDSTMLYLFHKVGKKVLIAFNDFDDLDYLKDNSDFDLFHYLK